MFECLKDPNSQQSDFLTKRNTEIQLGLLFLDIAEEHSLGLHRWEYN